ncbi:MAG: hypothetical protein GEEBNDBF_01419 [bacterium]|nr:hypothetical protein [bacterium]
MPLSPDLRPHRLAPDPTPPSRIWPSLAAPLLLPLLSAMGIVTFFGSRLTSQAAIDQLVREPPAIAVALSLTQLIALLMCVIGARGSKVPAEERVALLSPWGSRLLLTIAPLGALGVVVLTTLLHQHFFQEPPEEAAAMSTALQTTGGALRWILAGLIMLSAPVTEELFYRGFVLRGLLRRLPIGFAILVSGWLFAMAHGSGSYQLLILPLGCYLGWISLVTRSIWPAVWAHMLVNGFYAVPLLLPEELALTLFGPAGTWSAFDILGVATLPVACWLLLKTHPPDPPSA